MTLNHIHLGSRNLTAFQKFYSRYFGFRKACRHRRGLMLRNESGFILEVDPVEALPEFPPCFHLGFSQPCEHDVFRLYDRMKCNNENVVKEIVARKNYFASFFVKDPDGNNIEVSWYH